MSAAELLHHPYAARTIGFPNSPLMSSAMERLAEFPSVDTAGETFFEFVTSYSM